MDMYQSDDEDDNMQVMQQAEEEIQLAKRGQRRKAVLLIAVIVGAIALLFGIFVDESVAPNLVGRSREDARSSASNESDSNSDNGTLSSTSKPVVDQGASVEEEDQENSEPSTPSDITTATATITGAPEETLSSTTKVPTEKPIATNTESPTSSPLVITPGCIPTDRFDNEFNSNQNNRLFAGQFICSDDANQRYHFGLTSENADLIWLDTATQESVTYASNPVNITETTNSSNDKLYYYLSVRVDGTFVLNQLQVQETNGNNNSTVVWELKPKYPMDLWERCLTSSPQVHDCPYLHLHNDGVIVLNWIDAATGSWETRNIKRAYDFPDL